MRVGNVERLAESMEINPRLAILESVRREEAAELFEADANRIRDKAEFADMFLRKKHPTTLSFYC